MFFLILFVGMLIIMYVIEERDDPFEEPEPLVGPCHPRWWQHTRAGYKPPRRKERDYDKRAAR